MWAKVLPLVSRIVSQSQLEVKELEDMQWKFGVTAASDEMRRVGSTFLQVHIKIRHEQVVLVAEIALILFIFCVDLA